MRQDWYRRLLLPLCFLLSALFSLYGSASAEDADTLDAQLNEQVLAVPIGPWPQIKLQVTFFRPAGPGPFPVAVLNHGKDLGLPSMEKRYRSAYAARYYLSRGYAVILPMMRGFAGSEGQTWVKGCDLANIGLDHAKDIRDLLLALSHSEIGSWLDLRRIVISGQSLGGWNALAAGSLNISGVRGLVNFAGGIHAPGCALWEYELEAAAGRYGAMTRIPSIWFYGDNDSKFSPAVWEEMKTRYAQGGGQVTLVDYGKFQDDSHNFLGHIEALPIWIPRLDAFLDELGLPNQDIHPELLPAAYPVASGFADVKDLAAIPIVGDKGREDYRVFLEKVMPRVFAIATDGSTISTDGGYDPLERAFGLCQQHHLHCQAYAIDDQVVWPKPIPVPPPTKYASIGDAYAIPYLNATGRVGYERFLTLPTPRAFVIAADGAWSFSARDFDVLNSALQQCVAKHLGCKLYAVNDQVVWSR
jgi:dienelactone hydrolase